MMAKGVWFVTCKSDPRWNAHGKAIVGMFAKPEEVTKHVEKMLKELNCDKPPADLEWGYHKY